MPEQDCAESERRRLGRTTALRLCGALLTRRLPPVPRDYERPLRRPRARPLRQLEVCDRHADLIKREQQSGATVYPPGVGEGCEGIRGAWSSGAPGPDRGRGAGQLP